MPVFTLNLSCDKVLIPSLTQVLWETIARAAQGMKEGSQLQKPVVALLEACNIQALVEALQALTCALGTPLTEVYPPMSWFALWQGVGPHVYP